MIVVNGWGKANCLNLMGGAALVLIREDHSTHGLT